MANEESWIANNPQTVNVQSQMNFNNNNMITTKNIILTHLDHVSTNVNSLESNLVDKDQSDNETDDEDDCFTILEKPRRTSFSSDDENELRPNDQDSRVPLSREIALVKLTERTQYEIMQENGQRRYGPPPDWQGLPPGRGCEIFIGKIPRDCFEDELVPIFEKVGKIYMFRLMMDFSGCNRGYGFCIYTNREDTKRAVLELDNYEIRKGRVLGVCQSLDNCRLFVGGIPKSRSRQEIFDEMKRITDGVKDVIIYTCPSDKNKNRGFAFIEYESHKAAAMARRKLIPSRYHLFGHQIAVDWAEPEREIDDEQMSKVRILYVRGLMVTTTEDRVKAHFNQALIHYYAQNIMNTERYYFGLNMGQNKKNLVERVKKIRDYAFVHFCDRPSASFALKLLNGSVLEGSRIEVTWAKPADRFTRSKLQMTYTSGYMNALVNHQQVRSQEMRNSPQFGNENVLVRKDPNQLLVNLVSSQCGILPTSTKDQSLIDKFLRKYQDMNPKNNLEVSACFKEPGVFDVCSEKPDLTDSELFMITPLNDKLTQLSNHLGLGNPIMFTQIQSFSASKTFFYSAQVVLTNLNHIFMTPQPSFTRQKAAQNVVAYAYEWLVKYYSFKMADSSNNSNNQANELENAFAKFFLGNS